MAIQATVESFDEDVVRLIQDDGRSLSCPTEAVVGFRFLRSGQRVQAELTAEGSVERVLPIASSL